MLALQMAFRQFEQGKVLTRYFLGTCFEQVFTTRFFYNIIIQKSMAMGFAALTASTWLMTPVDKGKEVFGLC